MFFSVHSAAVFVFLAGILFSQSYGFGLGRSSAHVSGSSSFLSMLQVGDVAPDFELKNYKGQTFKLSSFKGKKSVVVFFYPADNTPGCTTEVCAFQKRFPDFKAANAEVFGVSSGGPADKEKFISSNKVTSYELLIDAGDVVRNSWKVPRALFGAFPGRVTYVIGKDGKVASVYDDLAKAALHVDKALEAVLAAAGKK